MNSLAHLIAMEVVKELRPVVGAEASEDMTVREIAARLKRHPQTVRELIRKGTLPGRMDGGRLVVSRAEVEAHRTGFPSVGRRRRKDRLLKTA